MLQNFHDRQWSAWKNGFLLVKRCVQKADVLIHVEDVFVRESFDVFFESYELLDVLILTGGAWEDGVVDYDAVYGRVGVGSEDCFFNLFFGDETEVEEKTAGRVVSFRIF